MTDSSRFRVLITDYACDSLYIERQALGLVGDKLLVADTCHES